MLNSIYKARDVSGDINDFDLSDVCEADEINVTAGGNSEEKEDENPRKHGLSKEA